MLLAVGGCFFATWPVLRLIIATAYVNHRSVDAERAQGFTVKVKLAPGWEPLARTEMTEAWKPLGLDGLNYFTYGAPETLFSRWASREDPGARRYQAWFGVYVVHHLPERLRHSLTLGDALLSNDQLQWLKTMGDPAPQVSTRHGLPSQKLTLDGREVDVYLGSVETHSDWSRQEGLRLAPWLGRPDQLPYRQVVDPFHAVSLQGFVAGWYDEKRDCYFAIYGNGARFNLSYGGQVDTWPLLKDELLQMAASVKIEPL